MNFTYPLESESLSSRSSSLDRLGLLPSLPLNCQFRHEASALVEQDGETGLKRLAWPPLEWFLGRTCVKVFTQKYTVKAEKRMEKQA